MLKGILIAVAVLVVIVAVAIIALGVVLYKFFLAGDSKGPDLVNLGASVSKIDVGLYLPGNEPWDKPFQRTGADDLPRSILLAGKVYRWQSNNHIHHGAEFPLMFEDGPWKWDKAQGRFAGKGINCGHYFGLSIVAANEEAGHYGSGTGDSQLLEIEGTSDRILDLTHPDIIREWFQRYVNNHERVSHSLYFMFQELIEQGSGGNVITDYFGLTAKREGYDGILFYSARVLKEMASYKFDRDLEGLTAPLRFWEFRTNPDNLNIVFFSGARLATQITSITVGQDLPFPNPYFGQSPEELDRLFQYDSNYQEERDRFTLHKPTYLE